MWSGTYTVYWQHTLTAVLAVLSVTLTQFVTDTGTGQTPTPSLVETGYDTYCNEEIHPRGRWIFPFIPSFRPASFLTEKWIWYICTIQLNSINPQRIHSFVRGCGCVVSRVTIRVGVGSCLGAASINSLPQYFGHRNDWRMWWEPMEAELFVQIVYQFGKWMKSSVDI